MAVELILRKIGCYKNRLNTYVMPKRGFDMNDIVLAVLASMAASGGLTALLVWLTKTWLTERLKNAIKYEYDQKLEAFKLTVQSEHNIALERIRSDLRMTAFEHETRFAKLHERRAEAIAEMHAHLQDLLVEITRYKNRGDNSPSIDEVDAEIKKCLKHFSHKKIYLPDEIEKQLNAFLNKLIKMLSVDSQDFDFDKSLSPLLQDLKMEFRRLLGDEPAGESA